MTGSTCSTDVPDAIDSMDTTRGDRRRQDALYGSLGVISHKSFEERVAAEGRLTNICINLERNSNTHPPTLMLTARAHCLGSSVKSRDPSWRGRHVEVSRLLMRELLATIRASILAGISELDTRPTAHISERSMYLTTKLHGLSRKGVGGSIKLDPSRWERESLHSLGSGSPYQPMDTEPTSNNPGGAYNPPAVQDSECDEAPGVRVVDIDWASKLRWGGDAAYNPSKDGNITLHGACTLADPCVDEEMAALVWDRSDPSDILMAIATHPSMTRTVCANSWTVQIRKQETGALASDDEVFGIDELQQAGYSHALGWTTSVAMVRLYGAT